MFIGKIPSISPHNSFLHPSQTERRHWESFPSPNPIWSIINMRDGPRFPPPPHAKQTKGAGEEGYDCQQNPPLRIACLWYSPIISNSNKQRMTAVCPGFSLAAAKVLYSLYWGFEKNCLMAIKDQVRGKLNRPSDAQAVRGHHHQLIWLCKDRGSQLGMSLHARTHAHTLCKHATFPQRAHEGNK